MTCRYPLRPAPGLPGTCLETEGENPLKTVRILGTHGVPANYGGFETAAQNVGLYLARRGWRVIVYCQIVGEGPIAEGVWNGLETVTIPTKSLGWRGTAAFDLASIRHAIRHPDLCLTFGYNTGVFNAAQRLRRLPNVINMDGIEWSRSRWGFSRQAILYVNERFSCLFGDHLIADHPEIEKYLRTRAPRRKITTITYGSDAVYSAPEEISRQHGLEPGSYMTLVCRPIPENSILELVRAFSRATRGQQLAIVGDYTRDDPYHAAVLDAASDEVAFIGSVYDKAKLEALRFHSTLYLHGHTVGGTNPSLVEAMGAGNPVLAHDNKYNRWVAQGGALYFRDEDEAAVSLEKFLADPELRRSLSEASRARHAHEFTWEHVAGEYERLLTRFLPGGQQ